MHKGLDGHAEVGFGRRSPDEIRQDLIFAVRILFHSPGFTLVAVLSLAPRIGANTFVFSVVNSLIFKPLPVSSPEELYFLQSNSFPSISFPNYRDLRDRSTTLSDLIGYRVAAMGLEASDSTHRVWGYLATGNYFETLGVRPVRGRFFQTEGDWIPNASPFAVLSYTCWRNRFAGDPQIVGKTIHINTMPYTVLGVAPPGFTGPRFSIGPRSGSP